MNKTAVTFFVIVTLRQMKWFIGSVLWRNKTSSTVLKICEILHVLKPYKPQDISSRICLLNYL